MTEVKTAPDSPVRLFVGAIAPPEQETVREPNADPNVITNFGDGPAAVPFPRVAGGPGEGKIFVGTLSPTGPKTVRRKHLPFSALGINEMFFIGEAIWYKRGWFRATAVGKTKWFLPWTEVRTLRTVKKIREVTL